MNSVKEDIIQCIVQLNGGAKQSYRNIQTSVEELQKISANEGLSEHDLDRIINFLTAAKLSSSICSSLFTCFVPATKISSESLEKILLWFFTEVGHNKITSAVEKALLQWLTGIVYYELADISIVDSYFYSFLFLLNRTHVQGLVFKLLCLISKPEDAKRWVVNRILHIRNINGPRNHTNSLLSLLKSYKPEVVPERVPVTNFSYDNFGNFDEPLRKAHLRNLNLSAGSKSIVNKNDFQWNSWQIFDNNKMLPRLIPAVENLNMDGKLNNKKLQSILDLKTMASVGIHQLQIEYPAQILSLLANYVGCHILAFSGDVIKTRFSNKLYHTLCKVFLLELVPYSEEEKLHFLNSIKKFQEYTHQSIPVVTTFLFNYFLVWDGESYQREILGLLEWIEIRNEEDLQKFVFQPLRQIFLSSETQSKCLIIETMSKLIRNLLVMDKREKNCFENDYQECDLIKSIEAITAFVGGLVTQGLIWNNEKKMRKMLTASLDFYETTQAVEQAGDLPMIIIMPPSLVYGCLFSGSRVCIARLCSLLTRLQMYSVERLFLLGVFQDFADEVQQLNVYMLDYYRCLWSNVNFCKDEDSFIFHESIFCEMFWKFKENYGDLMEKIFSVECNSTFWIPQAKGLREVVMNQMGEDYPAILQLKQITEERLLRR